MTGLSVDVVVGEGAADVDVEWDGVTALTRVASVNLTDTAAVTKRKFLMDSKVTVR